MKIALAQLNPRIGDFRANIERMTGAIRDARDRDADLIVFPELSVSGYPPLDFLEFSDFTEKCQQGLKELAAHCKGIAAIAGAPAFNTHPKGKPLFNAAWLLEDGEIKASVHKTLLPNYDVFDEYRYFEPNPAPCGVIVFKSVRIALTICEDIWNISGDPLYLRNPMDEMAAQNPQLIINIAASPFHYAQAPLRREILASNAGKYGIPLVYVNQTGGQTELLFDGDSMVMEPDGSIPLQLPPFREETAIWEFDPDRTRQFNRKGVEKDQPRGTVAQRTTMYPDDIGITLIHDALIMGIRDYFDKMGFSKAILGLSGGIDSAVTLVLAARALGAGNVRGVLLPSPFSSEHSITDAVQLAEKLTVPYDIIPISGSYDSFLQTLATQFQGQPFNLTEENIQARTRAVILMALSNKFGYILLNTSNKSEAAVGYGTLYGDMCGGLSVLGDLYKTQVYQLARFINRNGTIIPENSILKSPSAELRHDQKDSDSLPEYDILDPLLYYYIEHRFGPDDLKRKGFEPALVDRVLKLVNTNEYKRHQAPPILRVSPKAFGQGRRMPIAAKYLF